MATSVVMCGSVRSLSEFHYITNWLSLIDSHYKLAGIVWSTWDDVFVDEKEAVAAWRAKGFDIVTSNPDLIRSSTSIPLYGHQTSAVVQALQLQAALKRLKTTKQILKIRTDMCASRISLLHTEIHRKFAYNTNKILVHHVSTLVPFDIADIVYMGPIEKVSNIGNIDFENLFLVDHFRDLPTESIMFGGWAYQQGPSDIRNAINTMMESGFRDRVAGYFGTRTSGAEMTSDMLALMKYYMLCVAEYEIGLDSSMDDEPLLEDLILGKVPPWSAPYRTKNAVISRDSVIRYIISGRARFNSEAGEYLTYIIKNERFANAEFGDRLARTFFADLALQGRLHLSDTEIEAICANLTGPSIFDLFSVIIKYVFASKDRRRLLYWLHVSISFGLDGYGLDCLKSVEPSITNDPMFNNISLSRSDANDYLRTFQVGIS